MKRILGVAFLGIGLLAPMTVMADDHHDQMKHEWNDGERDAWHRFLKENHMRDHEWERATKREQAKYWKWREHHRD